MTNFRRSAFYSFLILLVTLATASAFAATPEPPAVPADYVTDLAGVMDSASRMRLNALLQELERKTTAQVLVLTVKSLDQESIEEFSFATKEKWKLGQKGKDNGVLLVVSVGDRKYRIEVGYGLEGVLPDSLVGTIGREYLVPYFRKGAYGPGISAAMQQIATTIAEAEGVSLTGQSGRGRSLTSAPRSLSPFQMIVFGVLGIIVLILLITHPRQCFLLLLASQMGGRGGWSGGGGGFGGGSFGGGGGGSGGGGGASGSW